MSRPNWEARARKATVVIAVVVVVGAMKVAQSAIVPVLFAVFLAMLLSPAVEALRRVRLPRALGAAIVLGMLGAITGDALMLAWGPAREWLDTAPTTMATLERKLEPVTRIIATVQSVSEEADRVTDPTSVAAGAAVPAVVAEPNSTMEITQDWVVAVTTTLIVAYFLMVSGPTLLARLELAFAVRGVNTQLLQAVTIINADMARYFATVTLCNLALGAGTAIAMHWLGMPSSLLWGLVAFLLNYVPYAGSATTLVLLTVVALVSFDALENAVWVAGSFLVLTGIEGQILQPVLVGRRFEVSPLLVLLALWFGGWLWGIAGVALAVPLLVAGKSLVIELQAQSARSVILRAA